MMTALGGAGWDGLAAFGLLLLSRPVRMLPMKLVFVVFKGPGEGPGCVGEEGGDLTKGRCR